MQEAIRSPALSIAIHGEQYLTELLDANLSERTISAYRDRLRYFGEWLASTGIAIEAISRDVILQYISDMRAADLAPKYQRDRLSAVKGFFEWLVVDKELLPKNPIARIRRAIKVPRRLPRVLEESDAMKLMDAAETARERVIMELLYGSGIRASELLGIQVEDLNLAGSEVLIRGKGGDEAIQPISPHAVAAIQAWLPERAEMLAAPRRMQAAVLEMRGRGMSYREIAAALNLSVPVVYKYAKRELQKHATSALLIGREGPISYSMLRLIVKEVAARTDIAKSVYPHLLRHCFATHLLNGGANLKEVQELIRHKNLATTQIYLHVSKSGLRAAYDRAHPRARMEESNGAKIQNQAVAPLDQRNRGSNGRNDEEGGDRPRDHLRL